MGYNIEVSFNALKQNISETQDLIITTALENGCNYYNNDFEFENNLRYNRNHCVITLTFQNYEGSDIDYIVKFLKIIKNLNTNIDSKGALYIYLKLSLRQLISLEERNQIMTTSFFLMLSWNDPRLSWDPAQYNDSREIITNNANCKYL